MKQKKAPRRQPGAQTERNNLILTTAESSIPQTVHSGNLASPKQTKYLNTLRRIIGLERWNAAKTLLGIQKSGTFDLTTREASRLIKVIKFTLEGGEL